MIININKVRRTKTNISTVKRLTVENWEEKLYGIVTQLIINNTTKNKFYSVCNISLLNPFATRVSAVSFKGPLCLRNYFICSFTQAQNRTDNFFKDKISKAIIRLRDVICIYNSIIFHFVDYNIGRFTKTPFHMSGRCKMAMSVFLFTK